MLKRTLSVLFALIFVMLVALPAVAATASRESGDGKLSDTPHRYAVKPGTTEWNTLTLDERTAATDVSKAEAVKMTTPALLSTVLEYPFIIDMFAYDSPDEGISVLRSCFPPLDVLLQRKDITSTIDNYLSTSVSNDELNVLTAEVLKRYATAFAAVSPDYLVDPDTGKPCKILKTPKGSNVIAIYGLTWSDHGITRSEAFSISRAYLETYPGITWISDPNPEYNCHAYAWHSTSSVYWIQNPTPYIYDDSYVESRGDIGAIITYSNSGSSNYSHSGIVFVPGVITSKWGEYAVFRHSITSCPYYRNGVSFKFWKLNSN